MRRAAASRASIPTPAGDYRQASCMFSSAVHTRPSGHTSVMSHGIRHTEPASSTKQSPSMNILAHSLSSRHCGQQAPTMSPTPMTHASTSLQSPPPLHVSGQPISQLVQPIVEMLQFSVQKSSPSSKSNDMQSRPAKSSPSHSSTPSTMPSPHNGSIMVSVSPSDVGELVTGSDVVIGSVGSVMVDVVSVVVVVD